MPPVLKKVESVELRGAGLDERWLQDRIRDDTSLLGLGELEIVSREHRQPVGGRIDFLMRNGDTYYEVEVMLGALDESHIIRTIEYWDIERQRRPQYDHVAVIVAERITSRFFNVLRLLNRSVPMIAVQLNGFKLNDAEIAIHAVTVLNVMQEIEDDVDVDPSERADRALWERQAPPPFLAAIDAIVAKLREEGLDPRVTYNRHHVALGTANSYNFCWFHARRFGNCNIEVRLTEDTRDDAAAELHAVGIEATSVRTRNLATTVNQASLEAHMTTVINILKRGEAAAQR
jgi:hypothetical protein